MASLRRLMLTIARRRRHLAAPKVIVATDVHGCVTVVPAPESREFWRQCPWAGDDEESVEFRRVIEREFG